MHRPFAALCAAALAAAAGAASAHDSWLDVVPGGPRQTFALSFQTGARYPAIESSPSAASVADAACVDGQGRSVALRPRERAGALHLAAAALQRAPLGCTAALSEHAITLEPSLVDVYFREIRPADAVRDTWAAQREAGLPWRERYRKFARIEVAEASATPQQLRAVRAAAGLPLEIVVEGDAPLRVGQGASFRVLASGQAVVGLAVEIVGERGGFGIWSRSDAQGRLRTVLPFGGRWLLRATLVEPAADGAWDSRFVTLAFDAKP